MMGRSVADFLGGSILPVGETCEPTGKIEPPKKSATEPPSSMCVLLTYATSFSVDRQFNVTQPINLEIQMYSITKCGTLWSLNVVKRQVFDKVFYLMTLKLQ